jgi:hypothetical protein
MNNITEITRKYDPQIIQAWGDNNAIKGVMENRQILREYSDGWILDLNVNFNNIMIPITKEQAMGIIRGEVNSYQATIETPQEIWAVDSESDFLVTHKLPRESDQRAIERAKTYYDGYEFYVK